MAESRKVGFAAKARQKQGGNGTVHIIETFRDDGVLLTVSAGGQREVDENVSSRPIKRNHLKGRGQDEHGRHARQAPRKLQGTQRLSLILPAAWEIGSIRAGEAGKTPV
ncbi:unnamed protein product [Prorocentrum cordatum]|nr:unnamed protein product [Polarella glacialis]